MLLWSLQPRVARPARVAVAVRRAAADAAGVLEAVGAAGLVEAEAEAVAVVVPEVAVGATDAAVDVAGRGRIAGKGASSSRT